MASVLGGGKVKLANGQIVNAQEGGWYDAQQYFGGKLSGVNQIINPNQQGAGGQVSQEVIKQTNPNNVQYIEQRKQEEAKAGGGGGGMPSGGINLDTMGAGGGGGGGLGGLGGGSMNPNVPNLPDLYKTLYGSSGISDIENQLNKYDEGYNKEVSTINDNPFLSEANRTGRIQKLGIDHENSTKTLRDQIATRKADIETQLSLQTKQFDINSQAAQQALSQFNTLLDMGALNGASGDDIAAITRSTGLSSSAIYSAIKANQAKNVKTQVIQYDDGENQGYAVINSDTGEIINRQVVGASKPTKGSGGGVAASKQADHDGNVQSLVQSIKTGITLQSLINYYGSVLGIEEIYRFYNTYSPNGAAKESLKDVQNNKFVYSK